MFLVGTVRTGRTPSPQLTGLQRDGHLVRLELEPLVARRARRAAAPGPRRPGVRRTPLAELARLSGGNLQVLTELVRGARERGVLLDAGGVWQPDRAAADDGRPRRARRRAPRRRRRTPGSRVLELLAVCERFGLADLERVHGAATLEALEASRLVTVVTSGRRTAVRLAHPLYGEVLRARLPPLRLRRIHQQLADLVEAHGARRREDVVQVALWRVASGGRVPGDRLLRAARLALAGHDPALAVRLVDAAARRRRGPAGERAEVLVEAHAMQGHDDEVERVVAAVWDEPLTDAQRAHLAQRLADTRFSGRRDLDGALAAHEAARQRLTDPEEIAAVDARRATLLAGAGRPVEALRIADAVGPPTPPRTRVELAAARATSLHQPRPLRRGDRARPSGGRRPRRAARLARPARHRPAPPQRGPRAGLLAVATPRPASCSSRPPSGPARPTRRGRGCGSRWRSPRSPATPAGPTRRSAASAPSPTPRRRPGRTPRSCGPTSAWPRATCCSASAGRRQPPCERADEVGDSPVATSVATRERTRAVARRVPRRPRRRPARRIREVVELARARRRCSSSRPALLHDLVRLGVAGRGGRPAARSSPARSTARSCRPTPATPRPLVERDADLLSDVVDRYEAIDVLGLAAEAAAELAELHRARGETRLATAAQQRSAELAARAGGIRTPVAGPRRRRRAADGAGAGGRPAGRRRPQQPRRSASASTCRRGPSTPTWPACTASSGSPAAPSWPRRSGPHALRRVVSTLLDRLRRQCGCAGGSKCVTIDFGHDRKGWDGPSPSTDEGVVVTPDDFAVVGHSWAELRLRGDDLVDRLAESLVLVAPPDAAASAPAGSPTPSKSSSISSPRRASSARRPRNCPHLARSILVAELPRRRAGLDEAARDVCQAWTIATTGPGGTPGCCCPTYSRRNRSRRSPARPYCGPCSFITVSTTITAHLRR